MDADLPVTDSVIRRNRRTHTLWAVLRESLDVFPCLERHVCKEQGCRLGALAAPAVPSDFCKVTHLPSSFPCIFLPGMLLPSELCFSHIHYCT